MLGKIFSFVTFSIDVFDLDLLIYFYGNKFTFQILFTYNYIVTIQLY